MQGDECPVCGGPVFSTCGCHLKDSRCESQHRWHTCPKHGEVVAAPARHARPHSCSCKAPPSHPLLGPD